MATWKVTFEVVVDATTQEEAQEEARTLVGDRHFEAVTTEKIYDPRWR